VEAIGQDGFILWEMIEQAPQAELLRMVPAVETLRQVWLKQYYVDKDEPRWRKPKDLPRSRQKIVSPCDTGARFSVRRNTKWEGYRGHLTETCDEDQPLLITNVETTTSASLDLEWADTIHQHLQEKDLLPKEHLVDASYLDARALADGESIHGLDLRGNAMCQDETFSIRCPGSPYLTSGAAMQSRIFQRHPRRTVSALPIRRRCGQLERSAVSPARC
jgi:transposase